MEELRQADTSNTATLEAAVPQEETGPKEELLSPKFAALARKEKALRSKYQELKNREEALKARETEYETSYIPKAKLKERLEQDPLGVMTEYGMTYDQLTTLALNQPGPQDQAVQKLQAKLQALESAQSENQKKAEAQQKQAYEQALKQIKTDAQLLIDGDENFETIRETGNVEAVVELIRETFDQEGKLLTVEEAAKEVESYLLEQALKMAQLKKVKNKLNPPEVDSDVEAEKKLLEEKKKLQPAMKTLTHSVTASQSKPKSQQERMQRAMAAFTGQLK